MSKQVTLARGGTEQRTLNLRDVKIPDLWHVAQAIREGKLYLSPQGRQDVSDMIIETWNIAHQLRKEWLRENGEDAF